MPSTMTTTQSSDLRHYGMVPNAGKDPVEEFPHRVRDLVPKGIVLSCCTDRTKFPALQNVIQLGARQAGIGLADSAQVLRVLQHGFKAIAHFLRGVRCQFGICRESVQRGAQPLGGNQEVLFLHGDGPMIGQLLAERRGFLRMLAQAAG